MSGVSATRFDPESEITRAMFVTMLYRLEKEPSTSRVNFKDVPKGSWYENAVSWASKKNIANGVTENTFAPDDKITREQLMTILYRYATLSRKSGILFSTSGVTRTSVTLWSHGSCMNVKSLGCV